MPTFGGSGETFGGLGKTFGGSVGKQQLFKRSENRSSLTLNVNSVDCVMSRKNMTTAPM